MAPKFKAPGTDARWHVAAYENTDISVVYELTIGKHTWTPGDSLHLKHDKGVWLFGHHATNTKTNAEWINVLGSTNGQFKSVRQDDIKIPVQRRRRK